MKKVFIACSSYDNIDKKYLMLASKASSLCCKKDYEIVMGGRKTGMMKEVYDACIKENGNVSDIYCAIYNDELSWIKDTTIKTKNVNEQIDFFLKCDILLFLPGGYGTFNEIFSSLIETFTGKCKGKLILFNYDHFYDELIIMIDKLYKEKFIDDKNIIKVVNSYEELESLL